MSIFTSCLITGTFVITRDHKFIIETRQPIRNKKTRTGHIIMLMSAQSSTKITKLLKCAWSIKKTQTHLDLEFRSALNLQLKTGCRMFPCIWKTTGLHSGSPPNWKTYLGSGSDRTTTCNSAVLVLFACSFPSFNQPSLNTTGPKTTLSSSLTPTLTLPSSFPLLRPHVLPMRPV